LDEGMWLRITKQMDINTKFYREVFGVYPDDFVKTFDYVEPLAIIANKSKYDKYAKLVKGVGVDFPL
jgi:hypothetical protein